MSYRARELLQVLPMLGVFTGLAALGCDAGQSGDQGMPVAGAGDTARATQQMERGPRTQPETGMGIYTPEQHALYDGRFIVEGTDIYQAGTLSDTAPWDHMDDDASDLRPVEGSAVIDVNEIQNTGTFRAEMDLPEGTYVIELEEWVEFSPNPAAMQLDFYIRSPESNEANHPSRQVFDHFFAMAVTWR